LNSKEINKTGGILEIHDRNPSKSLLEKVDSYVNRNLSKWQNKPSKPPANNTAATTLTSSPTNNLNRLGQESPPVMPNTNEENGVRGRVLSNEIPPTVSDPVQKVGFSSFIIGKILGAGAFGKVYLVKKRDTGRIYAMKALKKRNLIIKKQLRYAVTEANVLKMANHPFILPLDFAFQVFI
jgi:hypothetical protein